MKSSTCATCGNVFYLYRKVLRFCSPKCSSEQKKFFKIANYNELVKERFTKYHIPCEKSGCWIWNKKYKDRHGRGYLHFRNTTILASRASYILYNGEIPKGMFVCHKCDNYSCVNPNHLFLGSPKDNVNDRDQKGRSARGNKIGVSKLTSEKVLEIREIARGGLSQEKIARKYSVAQATISKILLKKTWRHI